MKKAVTNHCKLFRKYFLYKLHKNQSHKNENLNFAIVSPIVPNSKVETSSLDRRKMKIL